jgi:hypothetical protein
MTKHIDRRSFLQASGTSVLFLTAGSTTAALSRDELRQAAKEDVASDTEYAVQELTVTTDSKVEYPTIAETYYHAKIRDPNDGQHARMLDGDANVVDKNRIESREADAYRTEYGKLTPDLADRVESASAGEEIPVGVWHVGADRAAAKDAVGFDESMVNPDGKQTLAQEVRRRIRERSNNLASYIDGVEGAQAETVGEGEPRVGATATPSAIDEIEAHTDVTRLFHADQPEVETQLYESSVTHETYPERNDSYDASGYPVGVYGLGGYPKSADVNIGGSRQTFSSTPKDSHAHQVALAAASTRDKLPGTAHKAGVHCTYDPSNIDSKMAWHASRDVAAVNCSWGWTYTGRQMREEDLRFSQYGINYWLNVVVSAGNYANYSSIPTITPAKGFNQYAVGAINNKDTGTDKTDDHVASYSSWRDPLSKHAYPSWDYYPTDKPEVSAVGNPSEFPGYSGTTAGTSFSAPAVAGLLTLLTKFSDDYGTVPFYFYPEVAKPVLMASATNTGDGSSDFEKMGPGAIVAEHAEHVIANDWFVSDVFWKSNATQTYPFYANESDESVRVAFHWATDATLADFWHPSNVQSDLDLDVSVYDPDGNVVGWSWAWDRSFEWVEFDPQKTGTYEIRVHKWRWDSSDYARWMGLAWYRE